MSTLSGRHPDARRTTARRDIAEGLDQTPLFGGFALVVNRGRRTAEVELLDESQLDKDEWHPLGDAYQVSQFCYRVPGDDRRAKQVANAELDAVLATMADD